MLAARSSRSSPAGRSAAVQIIGGALVGGDFLNESENDGLMWCGRQLPKTCRP